MAKHRASKLHSSCTMIRRVEVTHGVMSLDGAPYRETGRETVTQRCGVPLFAGADRTSGCCKGCAAGWEVEGNRRATEEERREFLAGSAR